MMEFLFGFFIGAFTVVLVGLSFYLVKDKNYFINDYNNNDEEFDSEITFKPEGTT